MKRSSNLVTTIYLITLALITFALIKINYPYILSIFSPLVVRYKITVIAMHLVNELIPFIAIYIFVLRVKYLKSNKALSLIKSDNPSTNLLRKTGIFIMSAGLVVCIITIAETIFIYKSANFLVMVNSLWKLQLVGVILFEMTNIFEIEHKMKRKLTLIRPPAVKSKD